MARTEIAAAGIGAELEERLSRIERESAARMSRIELAMDLLLAPVYELSRGGAGHVQDGMKEAEAAVFALPALVAVREAAAREIAEEKAAQERERQKAEEQDKLRIARHQAEAAEVALKAAADAKIKNDEILRQVKERLGIS